MPELPEVETARRLAERVAVGRRIAEARCAADALVLVGVTGERLRAALQGRQVAAVGRHGKHLWLELDRRPWVSLHFGMTGRFHVPDRRPQRLISSGRYATAAGPWPPRFTKLHLVFDDGGQLVMSDPRRFGRIRLIQERADVIDALGFDALTGVPGRAAFANALRARAAPVKAVLLDQGFAAGVGNWIADEVLYQAGIDPRRRARTLSPLEAERIRRALRRVIGLAVRAGADSDRYPRRWLFHARWGKETGAVTARGEGIRHVTVGGRTTAWVPSAQR